MKKAPPFTFDKVHTVCKCALCVHKRLLRLMADLDTEYGVECEEMPAQKETVN
jgi:hypothetical protein